MRTLKEKFSNLLIGPLLVVAALACLWGNEGRFNYHRAAKETTAVSDARRAPEGQTVSYTGPLGECRFSGEYVQQFAGYYHVRRFAEIYCWIRDEDDRGRVTWSKRWESHPPSNERNSEIRQQLHSRDFGPPSYRVGDLEVESSRLHFADAYVTIWPRDVQLSDAGRNLGLTPNGEYLYLKKSGSFQEVGDERVSLRGIRTAKTATYFGVIEELKGVGKQYDLQAGPISALVSQIIQNDGVLHHLVNGMRKQALATIKADYSRLKWIVRLAGTAVVVLGLVILFSSFLHFIIAIPWLGQLASMGVWLISIAGGVSLSLVTIVASMAYHSLWTLLIGLGILAILILALTRVRNRTRIHVRSKLGATPGLDEARGAGRMVEGDRLHGDSRDEVRKSFCNLVRLAMVDGKLEPAENNFLAAWGRSKGLPDEAIVELFDRAKRESEEGLEATSLEDLHSLISLAMSDGYLSLNELNHIINFGQKLGMTRTQVNAAITQIRNGQSPAQMAA